MLADIEYPDEPTLRDFKLTWLNFPQWILLVCIRVYQRTVSRALPGNTCRFYPSCSHYAYQAIFKYGFLKGSYLAITRILRCNPFNPGGYDPVP